MSGRYIYVLDGVELEHAFLTESQVICGPVAEAGRVAEYLDVQQVVE